MEIVVILALVALALFLAGREWRRIDAPVNPPGRVRIRRRYDFWLMSVGNIVRYTICIAIGAALGWVLFHRPDHPGGRNIEVSAPADRSPDRAGVVTTMNAYFAGFNTDPICRYTNAFSQWFRPPTMLADCKSTLSTAPEVQRITAEANGSVNVQVTFVSRRKAEAGQAHDVCTKWTSDFLMNREAGQLRIAEPPTFRDTPAKC